MPISGPFHMHLHCFIVHGNPTHESRIKNAVHSALSLHDNEVKRIFRGNTLERVDWCLEHIWESQRNAEKYEAKI